MLHITGEPKGRPMKPGVGLTDMCTGLYLHGAILAALRARDVTGQGQQVDTSLFETQVSLLANVAMSWLNVGQEAQRWGTAHPSIVPYDCFKTADAYFVVGAVNDRQFASLCRLLDLEHLVKDKRFVDNGSRVKNRQILGDILDATFSERNTADWMARFEGSGMPYGPINTMEKVFSHPQTIARDMIHTVVDESARSGKLHVLGAYIHGSIIGQAASRGFYTNQAIIQEFLSSLVKTSRLFAQEPPDWANTQRRCSRRLDSRKMTLYDLERMALSSEQWEMMHERIQLNS